MVLGWKADFKIYRASSRPLRHLSVRHVGDWAGFKADVQVWVTFPQEFDEIVSEFALLLHSVTAHRLCPGTTQITSESRLKNALCWTTPFLRWTVQPKLLSLAFDMQADLHELFPFRARPGGTSHIEKVPRHCQLMD